MSSITNLFTDISAAIEDAKWLASQNNCGYVVVQEILGRMWVRRSSDHKSKSVMYSTHQGWEFKRNKPKPQDLTLAQHHRATS